MSQLPLASRPMFVGARVNRVEDDRLVSGRGRFVADLRRPRMVEMVIVRSVHAHAKLTAIDLSKAREAPGVVAAVSANDLVGVAPFPDTNAYARPVRMFPLARGKARYAGAPVAAVVAADRYLAEDAAELIEVDYEVLPVVASVNDALNGDTRLYDDWEDNKVMHFPVSIPEIEELFATSPVVRGRYTTQRHTGVPLETRGYLAEYEDGRLTLWSTTQSPHFVRRILSETLALPERNIRVIAPDIGGSFGCKSHVYPEEVLSCWLAISIAQPVRFIEDRLEHMVASNHAREQTIDLEAALDDGGRIKAMRSAISSDVGSGEIWFPGIGPSIVAAGTTTGPYKIDQAQVSITCVVTNKTPSGAYRGYGQPEGVFALECLVDKAAKTAGIDRVEYRRAMLLTDDDIPFTTPAGLVLDSGSFLKAFNRTVEVAQEAYGASLELHRDEPDTRVGLGFATYVEGTAPSGFTNTGMWGAHETANIRVEPDGTAVVSVGVTTTGQGVTSMVATLAADALGVARDAVRVEIGDTDKCPMGQGGWGSRSTVIGGGAVLKAAGRVREKMLAVAAHVLEVEIEDLTIQDGQVEVVGTDVSISVAQIADIATVRTYKLPAGMEGGLEESATYEVPNVDHWPDQQGKINPCPTYANASHAAVVTVDIQTGHVKVLRYVATHDCGRIINPTIVDGQVQGGIAQGVGGALLEHLVYGPDGQLMASSFMDYLLPSATDVPPMVVEHFETPAPYMPLGVKGVGEGGVIGGSAAIANAVVHALAEFDIEISTMPITPPRILALLDDARGSG